MIHTSRDARKSGGRRSIRLGIATWLGATALIGCAVASDQKVVSGSYAVVGTSCKDSSTGLCWPYCTSSSCARGITADVTAIKSLYESWRDRHVLNHGYPTGATNKLRVWKTDPTGSDQNTTVSEGQAYGMLFAALFDEQDVFDNLWRYAKGFLDTHGLMNWCIKQDNTLCSSQGAATDADVDFALALVFANKKVSSGAWSSSATWGDYKSEATNYLNAIYAYEIAADGYTLAGDLWPGGTASGVLNPSYFSPAHYRVFNAFENGTRWSTPITRIYQNIDAVQQNHGKCSKLVYNWSDRSGAANYSGGEANIYSFDATRTPARIVLDKLWFASSDASATVNEIGGFFKQVGMPVGMRYNMDGQCLDCGTSAAQPTFTATNAVAVWAADQPINPGASCGAASAQKNASAQQAYDATAATHEPVGTYTYYNWSWELIGRLIMSGNFPNLLQNGAGGSAGTGGSSGVGGATMQGGSNSTGGTSATGGSSTTGGKTGSGGSSATGGSTASGGTLASGGSSVSGGASGASGSSGSGGGSSAEPCTPSKTISGGQSGNFWTKGAYCFRTPDTIHGWGCSNFNGRTLKINIVGTTCGSLPVPAKYNGYYYFDISAGTYEWASIYWW